MIDTRRFLIAAPFLALAVSGCGRESIEVGAEPKNHPMSSGIIGGTTTAEQPAVALIYNAQDGYICTGTVIDDRLLLTAAHCVEDTNAANYQIGGGADPFNGADWVVGAVEVASHPGYSTTEIGVRDVGVIVLDAAPPVTPLPWQEAVDHDVYQVGTSFLAVGYGVSSSANGGSGDGVKRKVTLSITETYLDVFEYGDGTKNTCSGDSGGPAIANVGGVDTVIGVVSFGDSECAQYGYDMRTDHNAAFIASYMGAGGGGGGGGPTPTPTPGGGGGGGGNGGGDDDDDDGGNGADNGFGLGACSVTAGGATTAGFPFALGLMVAGLFAVTRRRRS